MTGVRIRLLGGLEVEGRRASDVGSRKARCLLAALALDAPAPVSVGALAELLWGDDLPARPNDQVGVLVSRLRGVLGADRLVRHDAGYALVADWIDLRELEARTALARAHLHDGEPIEARLAATMALDLVRGPLLPEESGPWVEPRRAAVDRTVATAGLVAAEAALAAGDPLGAAAAAATGLDHDPYDEAALRTLMRAHLALGRPASALAAYAEARRRLAEDLGVSPADETEALHQSALGDEPAGPASADGWDPLVQRARVELATFDIAAARRDAEEAIRRGGGPGALEVAGWVAYYQRDFATARQWADEAAARTEEAERRASCLTLTGRIRHSSGDLAGSEADLQEAVQSPVAGVRAMGEVWLGALRAHQGRPDEALELATRGAVDAAALRHPFVLPHSQFTRAYALGQQGRVADLLSLLDGWDRDIEDLGEGGRRFRPAADNFRAWALASIGQRAEAEERSIRTLESTTDFAETKAHALLDLAQSRLAAGDPAAAARWLDGLQVPDDDLEGTMVWHQRQRWGLLRGRLALEDGDLDGAEGAAQTVVDDARARGSGRSGAQAEALVLLVRARRDGPLDAQVVERVLERLDRASVLEAWRVTAELAAATGWDDVETAATRRAARVVQQSGDHAPQVGRFLDGELARLAHR